MAERDPLTAPGVPEPSEKDRAVEMARRVLNRYGGVGCSEGDVTILARQLLRALALPER
jgi:hypothetical protein